MLEICYSRGWNNVLENTHPRKYFGQFLLILRLFSIKYVLNCSLTLFRPGWGGFWGPRQLWRCITSRWLKLSPPNLATFPKTLLGLFWTYITWSPTLTFPWQPVFDSHVFQFLHFSVSINIFSLVYAVICVFSLSLATIYQIRDNLADIIPISVQYIF